MVLKVAFELEGLDAGIRQIRMMVLRLGLAVRQFPAVSPIMLSDALTCRGPRSMFTSRFEPPADGGDGASRSDKAIIR
jgi:hypothetical protein